MAENGSRGARNQAMDGCKLDSKWERIVHDTIAAAGLTHTTHPALMDGKGGAADFSVDGVYVEVWGLGDADYNLRRAEKLKFYFARNLPLVEIEPSDFEGKARAIRAKVQEILGKARARQNKLPDLKLPETRELRLDEIQIAETFARENGALTKIDILLEEKQEAFTSAEKDLNRAKEQLSAVQNERYAIIRRWIS